MFSKRLIVVVVVVVFPLQDFVTRAKLAVQHIVQKVGFFGILACASVSLLVTSDSSLRVSTANGSESQSALSRSF